MNITKRDENTRTWVSHREAWEQTREINMDLNEIEGGKKYNSYEHAAYYVLFVLVLIFIAFQVIRALV